VDLWISGRPQPNEVVVGGGSVLARLPQRKKGTKTQAPPGSLTWPVPGSGTVHRTQGQCTRGSPCASLRKRQVGMAPVASNGRRAGTPTGAPPRAGVF
jgi:hypothetical protein